MKLHQFPTLLLLILGISTSLFAQDYTVNKKSQRINNTKYEGYNIVVIGPLDKVTEQLYSYLKEKSKIRRKRNHYSITELKMESLALDSTLIYLKIDERGTSTNVWMAIQTKGLEEERTAKIEAALQEEMVLMARSYYVHEQEVKIKQSEAAAQVISKQQQSLIDENQAISHALTAAEARKIELEELLNQNKLTIEVLKQKLIDNKLQQDSTYLDLQKVNSVIEGQKQKLKEID